MRRKTIARILCLGLCIVTFSGMNDAVFATESTGKTAAETKTTSQAAISPAEQQAIEEAKVEAERLREAAKQKDDAATRGLYNLYSNGTYDRFTNFAQGYALDVDPGMTVDMSYSDVCAVLENDHKRIEIYRENLKGNVSQQAYINYSNKFAANTADHTVEFDTRTTINGNSVHILQWSRQKLARVENDKNYYASLEILTPEGGCYSIFVKSDTPFYTNLGYYHLANGFTVIAPTAAGYMRKSVATPIESRGWNQETQDFYLKYFGPASTLTWGLFEPKAPDDFTQMKYLETSMEYNFPILLNYSNFENNYKHPNLEYRLENTYKQGKTLELTLQTAWTAAGQGNMVYDVLDGEYDEFLKNYAQTIKDFSHPVLFRLGNEMNGDWCPYSSYNTSKDTMIFKEFYRYVHQIFEEAGVDNVIWIWNPNGKSFPDFAWNQEVMYYPGDDCVDIVGLTAYNTGTYYSDENWTEFASLYDPIYARSSMLYSQPMMITEFASSSVGGDKNQWIRNMFEHISSYPDIKVAVWWNGCDWDASGNVARPYFIDETPQIVQTFRELLNKKPWYWDTLG